MLLQCRPACRPGPARATRRASTRWRARTLRILNRLLPLSPTAFPRGNVQLQALFFLDLIMCSKPTLF
mgnify:CR=1 FL=1